MGAAPRIQARTEGNALSEQDGPASLCLYDGFEGLR